MNIAKNGSIKKIINRGDVYQCLLSPIDDMPKDGRIGKCRPCLIISEQFDDTVYKKIIPIRTVENYDSMPQSIKQSLVPIVLEENRTSYLDIRQERPISDSLIKNYIGTVTDQNIFKQIKEVHDRICFPEQFDDSHEMVYADKDNCIELPDNLIDRKSEMIDLLKCISDAMTQGKSIKVFTEYEEETVENKSEGNPVANIDYDKLKNIKEKLLQGKYKGRFSEWDDVQVEKFFILCKSGESFATMKPQLEKDFRIKSRDTFIKAKRYWGLKKNLSITELDVMGVFR